MNNNDPAQLLKSFFDAGQQFIQQASQGGPGARPQDKPAADLTADLMANYREFSELQHNFTQDMAGYWSKLFAQGEKPEKAPDRRFSAESWSKAPGFDMIRNTYLSYSDFLKNSIASAPLDDKAKGHLRFVVGQYLDALSPSNFFATNPEALQLAQETQGRSLVDGMGLFLKDLAKGRISMTDEAAFEVGRNVAVTEGLVVFENDLFQLIQYTPRTDQVYSRPLVIIPPCINKFYILDLQPENSFVRYIVEQGHTVFLVSWRNITPEFGKLTWDDYLESGVLRAIEVALQIGRVDRVNALGFCIGGTLLACALAVLAARGKTKASSLTLLTTMLDFSDAGEIGELVSADGVAAREAAIGSGGVLEGQELAFVFSSLRANDLIWQYVVNSYLKGKEPPAFDLLYWNSDASNLPGPMFCWYIRNTYLENNLKHPGRTEQCGVKVDLGKIDIPAFVYASREDHIVPWKTAFASKDVLKGQITFVLGASGHIAGVINPAAKNKRNYWTGEAGEVTAEQWLEKAASVPGSWWPYYSDWLAKHAGEKIAARKKLGSRKYRAIEPAPGRYVKEKADSTYLQAFSNPSDLSKRQT
jgi:polyhydroxyalkanoate synthase